MSQPNWKRVQEIFEAALALTPSERTAFIENACAGNSDLELHVLSLLSAHVSTGGILESPVAELDSQGLKDSDASIDKLIGTTIDGRYVIEKRLDPGGMSQVYLARNQKLQGQPVVIKILSETLVHDSYGRQKFEQEVEALLRIDHPGVVRVLAKGELNDGRPFIVMQYVEGETLRSQIPGEGMNFERAASILEQIGTALEHIHEQDVFHRDLKPENIMLKYGSDSVVLIDFGIAKVRDSLVAPSTANVAPAGTLVYMSPDQLLGEKITAASDVYSMALIAFEMVTGRRPFNPTSASHLLELQRKGVQAKPVALRPNLPPKAQDLILRGLSFNAKRRYRRAGEFGHQLARALTNGEVRGPNLPIMSIRKVAVVLALIIIASAGLFAYSQCGSAPSSNRSFTYFVMVQRVRDGKDQKDPIKSNGEETFDTGDKFQLNVQSREPGFLYVFNEGPPEPNDTNFTMIYPRKATNNGSATLGANQSIQFEWITFRGPAGNENFWLVWSVSPVNELESAKNEAFKHPRGGLIDKNLVAVREFLRTKQAAVKATVYHYNANQNAVVRAPSDLLITLAEFKHR